MRLVADNEEDYQMLARVQHQVTYWLKQEQANGGSDLLINTYKRFINTPIEKSYMKPGQSVQAANTSAIMDTEDRALIIPYIVHAAINRKKIAIEYFSDKKGVSKRVVEPFNWNGNNLVAWCHEAGAWRHFKPNNIRRIAVLDEDFDRPDEVLIVATDAKDKAGLVS